MGHAASLRSGRRILCRVLLASKGTRFVSGTGIFYRVSGMRSINYLGNSRSKRESLLRSLMLHVQYLLSLENSERTRKACLTYLQNWYFAFCPGHPKAAAELSSLAAKLQGHLETPSLRWKYAWLSPLLGRKSELGLRLLFHTSKPHASDIGTRLSIGGSVGMPRRQKRVTCTEWDQRSQRMTTIGRSKTDKYSKQDPNIRDNQDVVQGLGMPPVPKGSELGTKIAVALLTGGSDRPYVFGLTGALYPREQPSI